MTPPAMAPTGGLLMEGVDEGEAEGEDEGEDEDEEEIGMADELAVVVT